MDTQPRRNGSWFENLIDESFPSLVCYFYLHVCFYRLSLLLVLPTDITVTSPEQIELGQCKTAKIVCDVLGADPSRNLFDRITSAFSFSYVRTFLVLIHRVLTWIFSDSLSNTVEIPATIISKLYPPRLWLAGAAIGWGVFSTLLVSTTSS